MAHENLDVEALLAGTLLKVPPVASSVVRLFISSTFSDMTCERNVLMVQTYPRLKEFCKQRALEFQVVDMRWGVREEMQDDHMTSSLCMKEIHKSQHISAGPTFVILLGQKYGYRPFPACIRKEEFELIHKCLVENKKDVTLLEKWFLKDENAVPSVYLLQPISAMLPDYINKDDAELQRVAQHQWRGIFRDLQDCLRQGALTAARKHGSLTPEDMEKYFISVTEDEIYHGLLSGLCPGTQVCFKRTITDLGDQSADKMQGRFTDVMPEKKIDAEAQKLLRTLQSRKIPDHIARGKMLSYDVKWSAGKGVDASDHSAYLERLCTDFHDQLTAMILAAQTHRDAASKDELLTEVLQQANTRVAKCTLFQGREEMLDRVRRYLQADSNQMLVIHGQSGSGKTSLMAMSASSTAQWLPSDVKPVIIIRFLGTTPASSGVLKLLNSVNEQIARNYKQTLKDLPQESTPLSKRFKQLMECATSSRPLVIFLDSLDQLSSAHHAHRLSWLPWRLPKHVKLLVSTLPKTHAILPKLKWMVTIADNYMEVTSLEVGLSQSLVSQQLATTDRRLTTEQTHLVKEALEHCSLPLYVRLVVSEVARWRSYTPVESLVLQHSVEGIIGVLLERLEVQHGKVLVSHALSYITASRNGISESEMEDLLSLDDEVLHEVFTFWVPPIRRIPPLLWKRIHEDLSDFLVEHEASRVTVLHWYHRQFFEVTAKRYLNNEAFLKNIHSLMADFFLGKWVGVKKGFQYSDRLATRLKLRSPDGAADRMVVSQPLSWKSEDGLTQYNLRKMSELPFHLYKSGRFDELWTDVVGSYSWILSRIKAGSMAETMEDLDMFTQVIKDPRFGLLSSVLRVAGSSLCKLPSCLASEIVGRIKRSAHTDSKMESLMDQCVSAAADDCPLMPAFQCFDAPVESLLFALESHTDRVTDFIFNRDGDVFFTASMDGTVAIWDMKTGEQIHSMDITVTKPTRHTELFLTASGLVCESYSPGAPLCILDSQSGQLLHGIHSDTDIKPGSTHDTIVVDNWAIREGQVIDVEEGRTVKTLPYLTGLKSFVQVILSPDKKFVIVGKPQATEMYEVSSGKLLLQLPGEHIASQMQLAGVTHKLVIGYAISCLVKVFDVKVGSRTFGKEDLVLDYKSVIPQGKERESSLWCQEVSSLRPSKSQTKVLISIKQIIGFVLSLASKSYGDTVLLDLECDAMTNLEFASEESMVVGMVGCEMWLWDAGTGQKLCSLQLAGTPDDRFLLLVAPSGTMVATTANSENTVRLWALMLLKDATSQEQHVCGHPVDMVRVAGTARRAFVKSYRRPSSMDGYHYLDHFGLDIWDLDTYTRQEFLRFGKYGQLEDFQVSVDAERLVMLVKTRGGDHVYVIHISSSVNKLHLSLNLHQCSRIALHTNKQYLLTEDKAESMRVTLWDMEQGQELKQFTDCHGASFSLGQSIFTCIEKEGDILVYEIETDNVYHFQVGKTIIEAILMPASQLSQVLVAAEYKSVLGSKLWTVLLIDYKIGKALVVFSEVAPGRSLTVTPCGRYAVDGLLYVYPLLDMGKSRWQLEHQNTDVKSRVVLPAGDKPCVIWVDTAPVDCLKVVVNFTEEESKEVNVSSVSTHSKVASLTLVGDTHGLVLAGCEDGHFLAFQMLTTSSSKQTKQDIAKKQQQCFPKICAEILKKLCQNAEHVIEVSLATVGNKSEVLNQIQKGHSTKDSKICAII